jgi:hypothetical protein
MRIIIWGDVALIRSCMSDFGNVANGVRGYLRRQEMRVLDIANMLRLHLDLLIGFFLVD